MSTLPESWADPKKIMARKRTIVDSYRKISGMGMLPPSLFYWTLGGRCYNDARDDAYAGSEFDQVVRDQPPLIIADQWVSVEERAEVHKGNATIGAIVGGKWIHGKVNREFYRHWTTLKPGIINLDTIYQYKKGFELAGGIMMALMSATHPCLVVLNVIAQQQHHGYPLRTDEQVLKDGENFYNRSMTEAMKRWTHSRDSYQYDGTGGKSRTTMETWTFKNF